MKSKDTDKTANSTNYLAERTSRLQTIINILNAGTQPLEELVDLYEEGTKLVKECKIYLNKMESRIIDITKSANNEEDEAKA